MLFQAEEKCLLQRRLLYFNRKFNRRFSTIRRTREICHDVPRHDSLAFRYFVTDCPPFYTILSDTFDEE